jgi:hypothetical protein
MLMFDQEFRYGKAENNSESGNLSYLKYQEGPNIANLPLLALKSPISYQCLA